MNVRNQTIDIMRGIACICVVFVHSSNLFGYISNHNYESYIAPFSRLARAGVPIFFLLSGYLSFHDLFDYRILIIKKLKTIGIPFLIWNIFYICFEQIGYFLLPNYFENVLSWGGEDFVLAICGIPLIKAPIYEPFWFMRALFLLFIFYPLLIFIIKWIDKRIIIAGSLAIFFIPLYELYEEGYYIRYSLPFFVTGILIKKYGLLNKINKSLKRSIFLITTMLTIMLSYITQLCKISFLCILMNCICVLLFIYFVYYISNKICTHRYISVVLTISEYSFMIYALHGKILTIMQNLVGRLVDQRGEIVLIEYFLLPSITIILVVFISMIVKYKLSTIYKFVSGNR